jgi:predicted RNase H-like nuclease (RuvC/YqgF family)
MDIKKVSPENMAPSAKTEIKAVKKETVKQPVSTVKQPEKISADTKHYTVDQSANVDQSVNQEATRLNDEIRSIEQKSFSYQSSVDELKKAIDSDSKDPEQMYIKMKELNELKYKIMEADTERMRKVNELKGLMAEGNYKVSGSDIVKKMFE